MKKILLKVLSRFTSLNEEEQQAIVDEIRIEEFKKGTILLRQGDVPAKCYFVLKGCVRQYSIDMSSRYSFMCLEDSILVEGDLNTEKDMYNKYSQLESMTRKMIEANFGEVQDEFAAFIASTPEERYKSLLLKRPHLVDRVPQHQLASYLGITPESLSRIKKRILL